MSKIRSKSKKTRLASIEKITEGYTHSSDGTRIWFQSQGTGQPIVFCNGLGCSTFYFHYLEEYFKKNYQVITFDYRGHGKSDPPKNPKNHTIDCLIEDTKAVLDQLKINKAIFIGHSMGVQIIYSFYNKYPSKCLALIPCFGTYQRPMDTFLNTPVSKYVYEAVYNLNLMFPKLCSAIGVAFVKNPLRVKIGGMLNFIQPYLVDTKIVEEYLDHLAAIDPIFFNQLTNDMQKHSAKEYLPKIKAPTLIIAGEKDRFTPAWISKKMHRLIPDSELFVVKKGTHIALIEQPELINLRIEKFLLENRLTKKTASRTKRAKK